MADRDIDAEIEDAIALIIECQEKYRAQHDTYFSGPPYGLMEWGWYKPAPWINVVTHGTQDDFTIVANHAESAFDSYHWQKSADPQLTKTPREES